VIEGALSGGVDIVGLAVVNLVGRHAEGVNVFETAELVIQT
jgi:hypothetical protein